MNDAIEIAIETPQWMGFAGAEHVVRQAAEAALADTGAAAAEIGIVLTDDVHMRELNRAWRGTDTATNVLSFPAPAQPNGTRFLGDIAIAFETIEREAAAEGITLRDHLAHLTVHGVLHLLGFNHERDADAEAMEGRERAVLARLGISDPYAPAGTKRTEPA